MEEENLDKNTQIFFSLCASLVSQGWIQLGKMKNPMTDKIEMNLEAASMTIDMLSMLKAKTAGNLSGEEAKYIEGSVHDLKMNFVVESQQKDEAQPKKNNKPEEKAETKETTKEKGKNK